MRSQQRSRRSMRYTMAASDTIITQNVRRSFGVEFSPSSTITRMVNASRSLSNCRRTTSRCLTLTQTQRISLSLSSRARKSFHSGMSKASSMELCQRLSNTRDEKSLERWHSTRIWSKTHICWEGASDQVKHRRKKNSKGMMQRSGIARSDSARRRYLIDLRLWSWAITRRCSMPGNVCHSSWQTIRLISWSRICTIWCTSYTYSNIWRCKLLHQGSTAASDHSSSSRWRWSSRTSVGSSSRSCKMSGTTPWERHCCSWEHLLSTSCRES